MTKKEKILSIVLSSVAFTVPVAIAIGYIVNSKVEDKTVIIKDDTKNIKYKEIIPAEFNVMANNILDSIGHATGKKINLNDPINIGLRNNLIRFPEKILDKYEKASQNSEFAFRNSPAALLYYAGFFDSGFAKDPSGKKTKEETLEADNNAKQIANDLVFKKEVQKTDTEEGFYKAKTVRLIFTKLFYLTNALNVENPLNKFGENYPENRQKLIKIVGEILDDISKNYYFTGQQQYVNWWEYEIGIPKELLKNVFLVKDLFDQNRINKWISAIEYFVPDALYGGAAPTAIVGFRPVKEKRIQTGANLAENVKIVITYSVLKKDSKKIQDSIEYLNKYLFNDYVTKGDGYYKDGSFIQHDHIAYHGSYGEVLLGAFSDIVNYLEDTKINLIFDEKFENIFRYFELSLFPYMFKGSIADSLSGRSISRLSHGDKQKGLNIIASLIIISKNAPSEYRSRFENFLLEQLKGLDLKNLSVAYKIKSSSLNVIKKFLATKKIIADPERNIDIDWQENNFFHNFKDKYDLSNKSNKLQKFGIDLFRENGNILISKNQDRTVYNDGEHMLNISSHSKNTLKSESILKENLLSYYYGDGMTLLHTKNNNNPYGLNYWATINPFRIPGTTSYEEYDWKDKTFNDDEYAENILKIEKATSKLFNNSFSNGIVNDKLGIYATKIPNYNNTLMTKKVYLMIEGKLVVIGLTDKKDAKINTTVENRMNTKNNDNSSSFIKSEFRANNNDNVEVIQYQNSVLNEKNNYYFWDKTTATTNINKYKKPPYYVNNNRIEETDIENTYAEITINHENNNKFVYMIEPNAKETKSSEAAKTIINNLKIISVTDKYFVIQYLKQKNSVNYLYTYVVSFENNVKVDLKQSLKTESNISLNLNDPTTLVFKQILEKNLNLLNKKIQVIASSNVDAKEYKLNFTNLNIKTLQSRKINNQNEATLLNNNSIKIKTDLVETNDIKHNVWIELEF